MKKPTQKIQAGAKRTNKITKELFRIITTMDGVPVCKDDKTIMQFLNTHSCRYNAKIRTFKEKIRYHSRGLTKKQFFVAQKEWQNKGYISMTTLGWKGDHN